MTPKSPHEAEEQRLGEDEMAPEAEEPREPTDFYGEEAKTFVTKCIQDMENDYARNQRHLIDWRNKLFERGGIENQWIVLDRSNRWIPLGDDEGAGMPSWVPRCSTNVFGVKIRGVAALMDQSDPSQEWQPATTDPQDLAVAQVIDDVLPVLYDEIRYAALRPLLNKDSALTDKCALLLSYDNDPKYGLAPVPGLRCRDCGEAATEEEIGKAGGACPMCGMSEREEPNASGEMDMAGGWDEDPQAFEAPRGKLCAEFLSTFEFALPSTAKAPDERFVPWVLVHGEMPIEDAVRRFPKHARVIREREQAHRSGGSRHQAYAEAVRSLSSPVASRSSGGGVTAGTVTVYRLYHDPVSDDQVHFPEGCAIVMIDDTVVEGGPLPVKDEHGQPFKPVVVRSWMPQPGSPFGHPVADDMVPVQTQRNILETLLLLITMHYASPTEYVPSTVSFIDEPSGQPGQRVRYQSYQPGDKPVIERGINPPESLYRSIELCDEKLDEISGLNGVLQGERPEGNPTLGELQIRTERGMGSFKSPLDALVDFEQRLSRLLLYYARETAWAPRFRRVRGDNGAWDVRQFTNADLRGSVDVTCNPASAWPKSALMQQLRIEKAVEMGVLQPANDPELQTKLLGEMDLLEMKPSLDADRKQVLRILDRWKAAQTPEEVGQPDPSLQELPLHRHYLRSWLKTEEAEQAQTERPQVYAAMRAYIQAIDMVLTPPAPVSQTPNQSGASDGSAVNAAVESGVLRPVGGAEAPTSPLDALVSSGALRPTPPAPPGA